MPNPTRRKVYKNEEGKITAIMWEKKMSFVEYGKRVGMDEEDLKRLKKIKNTKFRDALMSDMANEHMRSGKPYDEMITELFELTKFTKRKMRML